MDEKLKTITIKVEPELHKKLKVYTIEKGLTVKDYLVSLIKADMSNTNK